MKKRGIYRTRVARGLSEEALAFVSSVREDERIFGEDIDGTEAHNLMLHERGIISRGELRKILAALERIRTLKRAGKLRIDPRFEDVHEFLEARVIETIGMEVGGKLHTGRSRNDQVALDTRMRVRTELNELSGSLLALIEALLKLAAETLNTPMVLYTHTQHAQIGTFGHYLLAQADILLKDFDRLDNCYKNVNLSPLGACAIGGSSFDLDRDRTASLLGFDGIVENSVEAVSSRDFALEAACAVSILMSDLSRISEDLVLWSSEEFGYLTLADEYASTSSVMPQKKNPCTLELIRGRTGEVYGALAGLFSMAKGLMTGYSRDLQQTKPLLWRCFDFVRSSVEILTGVIATLGIREERMRKAASESYAPALDLAEGLVKETGISFREAHAVVGEVVRRAVGSKLKLRDVDPKMVKSAAKKVLGKRIAVSGELIMKFTDPASSLSERRTRGSPSPKEAAKMLDVAKKALASRKRKLADRFRNLENADLRLRREVRKALGRKT